MNLSADRGVYTNRYFATSTGSIYVILNLQRSGTTQDTFRRLDIILYEKATATSPGVQVHMVNEIFVSAESIGRAYFHDLDPNKFYYILFRNESDDSYLSSKAISCSSRTIDGTL